ncbi:3-oxoacyl-[acyl-carrier protein] reductase [Actinoplanes tereljensis]|uniref:Beta-ketoacyl-ACP reductase n=1 Tax=Paractinoplanes tereljensis TaxID=571912 RepID=A0A919NFW3_9ACTN|nr:SDR family oxidoreductase [Actinoplanes tereljensis]GIF17830.1 beta-ketoacyl-ACP reductase [Actinoplanes tereljensis]
MSVPDLTGRVALITGAGRGMGAAHAAALSALGCRTILVDLDSSVADVAASLSGAVHVIADITAPTAADDLVAFASALGGLDILVHNAGLMHDWRTLAETPPESLDRYLAVNVTAPFALTRAAAPLLRQSKAGRVIFISSQWGQVPDGHSYGYMVSKAGQLGLMKALAKEFVADGVLVNAVAPGAVATRMVPDDRYEEEVAAVPLGRLGRPEEIADVVAFLASDAASFVTGQTIAANGGALIVGI